MCIHLDNYVYCVSYTVYSECDINRCQNGGACRKLGVSYICECVEGFSGVLCQTGNELLHMHFRIVVSITCKSNIHT